MFKKIKITLSLLFIVSVFTLLSSCNIWKNTKLDVSTYDEFTDTLFYALVGKDELTSNYYFVNREDYGLENYEPELPTPHVSSVISNLVTNAYFGRIEAYDYNELNTDQQAVYNLISNLLVYINSLTPEMSYLSNNYLGTYLGYQAQLPILLVEYHFRNKTDVENYFKFLELVPETFKAYYEFEIEKANHGYGMPDYVIDNVKEQCETFIEGIDNNTSFMYGVINDKIDNCSFLSADEKLHFKEENNALVKGALREGYEYVALNLPTLKGKATNDMGLAKYVKEDGTLIGRNYYEARFKYIVGYLDSCSDAAKYLDDKISENLDEYINLSTRIQANTNYQKLIESIRNNEYMFMTLSPLEQINHFKEMITADFPALPYDPEIVIKYVDPSMQNNFSPAAYMTSAIDDYGPESIYLNPASVYLTDDEGNLTDTLDGNYLYNTLAHEGIPGHLYQNVYFKTKEVNPIRKLLKNSGMVEGWATYVENYVYEYLRGDVPDTVVDYLITNEKLSASIYARLELGIHYDGWTEEEAYDFFSKYYSVDKERFSKAYRQLVEIPTNYQQYFYTYLKLCDLHDNVKKALGNNFNAVEFHQTILDCGNLPLMYIEKIVYDKYNMN